MDEGTQEGCSRHGLQTSSRVLPGFQVLPPAQREGSVGTEVRGQPPASTLQCVSLMMA